MNAKRIILVLSAITLGIVRFARATPTLTTLVAFGGPAVGINPQAGLTIDSAGDLFGATNYGGTSGYGAVFEVSGTNYRTLTALANFGSPSGVGLVAGLYADAAGNLYGTTQDGGTNNAGTVFELSGANHQTLTTLANLSDVNGVGPGAGLMADAAGNLYGTTAKGGAHGGGEVFEMSGVNHQTLTALASFNSIGSFPYVNANGGFPVCVLVADSAGNLYGTTELGGPQGDGTVFELSGSNHQTLTTLATFSDTNGSEPYAGLVIDAAGNLYGTTAYGGAFGGTLGDGTVFELSGVNHQILTTLVSFNNVDGETPRGSLIIDAAGNLYGTTAGGGTSSSGTVFELSGPNYQTLTTLASFTIQNGSVPDAGLIADAAGNLYGTTISGGSSRDGTVFELSGTGFVVPEPTSLSLLAFGSLGLLRRRRRSV